MLIPIPYHSFSVPFYSIFILFHLLCPCSIPLTVLFRSSETTDADKFDMVLELVADVGRVMFKLFQHPSLAIVKAAGLIMKSIIEVSKHSLSVSKHY